MLERQKDVVIVGAGPAGLTAAYELVKNGISPLILEKGDRVGGIARTESYKGYRFDIGGHRFFTKVPEVEGLWNEVLGSDLIRVSRLSRISYQGKFYNYPLDIRNTLRNLGLYESVRIVLSYLKWRVRPHPSPESLEQWVTNQFGGRLYLRFFKTYTEKVWGISCSKIQADWAAQRIQGLSLWTVAVNALLKRGDVKSLIHEFQYPVLGPGMMWEAFQRIVEEGGGQVDLHTDVTAVNHDGSRVVSVKIASGSQEREVSVDHVISSMPLSELVHKLSPKAPARVIDAASGLSYRDFLIVCVVVNRPSLFPDNWIYVHTPGVKVGRIQNFKNWSAELVPDQTRTSLGMEYFCNRGDELWEMSDEDLIRLASQELASLGLASESDIEDGVVVRQLKAYPVYDATYKQNLAIVREYISQFGNLQTIGRNGLHRYNNQDHSMLTGLFAARNILGENCDVWDVNTERSYHEDFSRETPVAGPAGAGASRTRTPQEALPSAAGATE